jgi:PAS domain S-box-containing protein
VDSPAVNAEPTSFTSGRRSIVVLVLTALAILASAASLALLTVTAQDATLFASLQSSLLIVNLIGVVVLVVLIGQKLYGLWRDWRRRVPGSRMKARAVLTFSGLALLPIMIVYMFSVNAINRGIDSWFDVDVGRGLDNALALSRAALSLRVKEFSARTATLAEELHGVRDAELVTQLERARRFAGAAELIVVDDHGRIVAASTDFAASILPKMPAEDVLREARHRQSYVSLEPAADGGYRVVTARVVAASSAGAPRVLVASYGVPEQLAGLADGVQHSVEQYGQRTYERPYLKSSFTLTLTIVLLLSALGAVYGAFFWATRLVRPVHDLIAGTQAVGKGDLNLRLSLPSHDEMGMLVHSFNEMTKRLGRARADAERNRTAVDQERARLAVVLARLSTGVISLDADLVILIANSAAGAILSLDLESSVGRPIDALALASPFGEQFVAACRRHLDSGQSDWREQLQFRTDGGRRELMVACTTLPAEAGEKPGLVLVFDDITTLLRAQRDAAWGEVARRLAHEIKNPLTPIQLSAERMRRRLLADLNPRDAEILERGTHTIVQQVEAMKEMVNAFSEYARAPAMERVVFDVNQLVTEVAELYRSHGTAAVTLDLDASLGNIDADRGRVRQVLNNLLTNACEALEGQPDSVVKVATCRAAFGGHTFLQLTVSDNGSGFSPELLNQVFDPYVTSKPKGTGLGLAIVKKIVDEHGGRVDADNAPEGGGRVSIVLPLDDAGREWLSMQDSREGLKADLRRERA